MGIKQAVVTRVFVLIVSTTAAALPLCAAPGPIALGGVPGANKGFYRITSDGDLLRIWRDSSAWQCHPVFTFGAAPAPDSLVSGQSGAVFGLNQGGTMFNTFFEGQLARYAPIDIAAGIASRSLATGGDSIYGVTPGGGIVRAWWDGKPGWRFETVPTFGAPVVAGSLIPGEDRVYGVNTASQLVNTFREGTKVSYGPIEGRNDVVAGSLALGGTAAQNTGVYFVTTSGALGRAFWNGKWNFQTAAFDTAIAAGSLISSVNSVRGIDAKGRIVNGFVDGGTVKVSVIGSGSGLTPGSLAVGGAVAALSDIYGVDAQGRLVRTFAKVTKIDTGPGTPGNPGTLPTARTLAVPLGPTVTWLTQIVSGVTVAPKSLISGDDGVYGLDSSGQPFAAVLANGSVTVVRPCPQPAAGVARRKAHLRVLRDAFGIADLSALGDLRLSGDLVPQSGLLRPRTDLAAGTQAIKAARRSAVVNNTPMFLPLAVTGTLLKSEPFPSGKTSVLGDIPIDTAYIVADALELADNTHIILKFPTTQHVAIVANTLTVGNGVTITYERQPNAPLPKPGKPSTPATPGQVSNDHFSKGTSGTSGTSGTNGGRGLSFTNSPAPEVELWVLNMSGPAPAIDLRGNDGGAGVPGGDGGDGGNGGQGSNSKGLKCFTAGPGDGGDGGNGGRAGDGGQGGDGAPGGRFSLYASSAVVSNFGLGFFVTVDGGSAGPGAAPGLPGEGGNGGPIGGFSNGGCSTGAKAVAHGARGGTGNSGAAGAPGAPQTSGPIKLIPVSDDEFLQAWEKPIVVSLAVPGPQSGRAFEGDTITVNGKNFTKDDNVLIDDGSGLFIGCETQYLGSSLIAFKVPAVRGGLRNVLVEQSAGSVVKRSNQASFFLLPRLAGTDPSPRIRPASTVKVKGSGFAPGMRVFLNDQEAGKLTFVSPDEQQLFVIRPKTGITANAAGEQANLKVALADGTMSNAIPVILDTYEIVVIGDSIHWGVGLAESAKFPSLVAQKVRDLTQDGNVGVYVQWDNPHTGAVIGLTPLRHSGQPAIPGEVSTKDPTIAEQVDAHAGNPDSPNVDLVLINGCINDLGVFVILDPRVSTSQLEARTKQACHDDMLNLLKKTAAVFPNAKIVDTSYFAPLSDQSAPIGSLLVAFLIAVDSPIQQIPGAIVGGVLAPGTRQRVIDNSLFFGAKSTEQLALAVSDANAAVGQRIFFANANFGPQNAALAGASSLLFGVNADGSPQDSQAETRKSLCKQFKDRTDSVTCIHASAGHPDERGAQQYANAIFPFLP
jgi:lysophospholipase L1-like esterase